LKEIMTAQLFSTVSTSDPLHFRENGNIDYRKVTGFLKFSENELSKISGISKKSIRFDNKIPNDLRDRLDQIANVLTLVAEYFDGDALKTALWFNTPNPMLGGMKPRDMIRLGRYNKLIKFVIEAREANEEKPS